MASQGGPELRTATLGWVKRTESKRILSGHGAASSASTSPIMAEPAMMRAFRCRRR